MRALAFLAATVFVCVAAVTAIAVRTAEAPTPPPAPTATVTAAATPSSTPATVDVALADRDEHDRVAALLEDAGHILGDGAPIRISDRTSEGARRLVPRAWALVVHPRAPLLDVELEAARALLRPGADWRDVAEGERPAPVRVVAEAGAAVWLARTSPASNRVAEVGDAAFVIDAVASDARAVGILDVTALDPAVRALVVDGHDPYRDAAVDSPQVDARWVAAPSDREAEEIATLLGWDAPPPDPAGFLMPGEMLPVRCAHWALTQHEDGFGAMFEGTRGLIEAADIAVVAWDPAVLESAPTPCERSFILSTAPEAVEATVRAGFDVVLGIGNHIGDCWAECSPVDAMLETLGHMQDSGLHVGGFGEDLEAARAPVMLEVDGVIFAVLGYDALAGFLYGAGDDRPGTAPLDLETLAEDVAAAKRQADHVVVGFSWGAEYTSAPTDLQRQVAREAITAGASLVVGNHPHWVQAVERIGDGFVAYGLGNFVFDQDWSDETTQGAIFEAGFTRARLLGVRLRPTVVRDRHRPELVPPASEEGRAVLDRIWEATDLLSPLEAMP